MIYPDENPLPDDYEVYVGYFYVVDGQQIESPLSGTVADLKRELRGYYRMKADDVRSCNIKARWADDRY